MQVQFSDIDNLLVNKKFVIGADEVGMGALAGPLVVCGVKASKNWNLDGLNDSKKLTKRKRFAMQTQLMQLVESKEISYHLVEMSNVDIDCYGLASTLKKAYLAIFKELYCQDSLIIADGTLKFDKALVGGYDLVSLVKADTLIPTVMAGSIIAKVYRDDLMGRLHQSYPHYDWVSNAGYPAPKHKAGIYWKGITPLHRTSYAPIKKAMEDEPVNSIARQIDEEILEELDRIALVRTDDE